MIHILSGTDGATFSCLRAGLAAAAVVCVAIVASPCSAAAPDGWSFFDLATTGRYADLYIPSGLDRSSPVPLVVFLHGAGAAPYHYRPFLDSVADQLGAVLVLPKSRTSEGWDPPTDRRAVAESLEHVAAELVVDRSRVAIAGHSAGGAFAVLLGLESPGWCAVFAMASPFVTVGAAADPLHRPPVRLYYGTGDPNWWSGSGLRLAAALEARGVAVDLDLQNGFGHNTWPDSSMLAGVRFLLEHPRIGPAGAPRQPS